MLVECAGHGRSIASDSDKIEQKRQQREFIPSRLGKCGLGLLLRSLCVCTVCLIINNDELFSNAFPFENLFYFISG